VVANVPVFEIMVCGLTGSQTPGLGTDIAFDEIPISSPPASFAGQIFGYKGFWTQTTGTLALRKLSGRDSFTGTFLCLLRIANNSVHDVFKKILSF
jgi:hypothetical protein